MVEEGKNKPGIKKGQKVEREQPLFIDLNKDYRIKMDSKNFTLQEKGKPKPKETEDAEPTEPGWNDEGHFSTNAFGLECIARKVLGLLILKKGRKEDINNIEGLVKVFSKCVKDTNKMFAPLDVNVTVNTDLKDILKTLK